MRNLVVLIGVIFIFFSCSSKNHQTYSTIKKDNKRNQANIIFDSLPEKYEHFEVWYNTLDTVQNFYKHSISYGYQLGSIKNNLEDLGRYSMNGDQEAAEVILNVHEGFLKRYKNGQYNERIELVALNASLSKVPPSERAFNVLSQFSLFTNEFYLHENDVPNDHGNMIVTQSIFDNMLCYFPVTEIAKYMTIFYKHEIEFDRQVAQEYTTQKIINDYKKGLLKFVSYDQWFKERSKGTF